MHVERDPTYDLPDFLTRLAIITLAGVLGIALACGDPVEAQAAGSICSRTAITGSTALDSTDTLLVVDEDCTTADAADYKRVTLASMLLLTGRVTEHATDCTGTTAIAPAVCYERDANTVYICDLAAGSSCTAANWTVTAGGSGLTSVAPADMDDADFGDWTCATGVCTLDNGVVGDADIAAGAVDGGNAGEIADGSVTADDLGTDSVSADELNATGVETELEAVLEVGQLQGGLAADQVDTITDIAAGLKSGSDVTLVTGTEGATDDCAKWNADGDLVSAGGACGVASGDISDVFNCSSGDCADIVAGATDSLDFSGVDSSGAGEGLILPQHATACAGGTAEGQVCWEADADTLYVGNGTTLTEVGTGGGGSSLLGGGTVGNLATGATRYFSIGGIQTPTATASDAVFLFPAAVTLTEFECKTLASPDNGGGTQSYAFTLYDVGGAASTNWTCTISEASTNCNDTTGDAIGAPSVLTVEVIPAGTPTARSAQCSIVYSVD